MKSEMSVTDRYMQEKSICVVIDICKAIAVGSNKPKINLHLYHALFNALKVMSICFGALDKWKTEVVQDFCNNPLEYNSLLKKHFGIIQNFYIEPLQD